jgi:glycosyltransferase involved in cell wall biosynthesis
MPENFAPLNPKRKRQMRSVSVVMGTFNGERFLAQQLESLGAQTLVPAELIVADDCSTDATMEIATRFCREAPFPVKVSQNASRLGYGENFLRAARTASGDFIAFCDQDDRWHPNKLEVATRALVGSGADLYVHTASLINEAGNPIGAYDQGVKRQVCHPPLHLGPWSVFYGCTMVFTKRLFELVDPSQRGAHTFEPGKVLSHDLWVYFLAHSVGQVMADPQALIDYRQHSGNVTPHVDSTRLRAWIRSLGFAVNPEIPRGAIAQHRSRVMARLCSATTDPGLRQRAHRAESYWKRIAQYEDGRVEGYQSASGVDRLRRWGRLLIKGCYRSYPHGGLGRRLLIKDMLVSVLHGRHWRMNAEILWNTVAARVTSNES